MAEKIRTIKGVVKKAVRETADTWTLYISVDSADKIYQAGQFISIAPHQFPEIRNFVHYLEHMKGKKELVRAYSLASAPHEADLSITTKPELFAPNETKYPPVLSPLLASDILVGRPIEFLGYTGAYTIKPEQVSEIDQVLHLCAGSGIVPNFSILKDELTQAKNPHTSHVLIDVNRTIDDIIYKAELDKLAKDHPKRFKLIHLLTRDDNPKQHGEHFFKGRPTLEFVSGFVKNPDRLLVYACGAGVTKWQRLQAAQKSEIPAPRFLESVHTIVAGLGVDKKRFKREVYG